MARSDLLVNLVRANNSGDRKLFRSTVEALIAEERAKQHNVLADKLVRALQPNGAAIQHASSSDSSQRGRDYFTEITPRRQLDDLVLTGVCRHACAQLIEEQSRADLLRAHGVEPRHRILLVGPPGNGKTSLAEAIAEALALPFLVIRYDAIIGSFLGETASRLRRVFDYARTTPCVLFFDEFDAIGKERGDLHETGEIKRVVTSLLMQVDDLPSYTVVVAATNHAELLDRAAWRRFQLRLELPAPTTKGIADFIRKFERRFPQSFGCGANDIAKRLGKVSFAEAEQFCLDIYRQYVLSLGEIPLRDVVLDQLRLWSARARSQGSIVRAQSRAGKTTSRPPRANSSRTSSKVRRR